MIYFLFLLFMIISVPQNLRHITDVGASSGNGIDSTLRIIDQYQRAGISFPEIISAGQSPFHVAFAAITTVSPKARDSADRVRQLLAQNDYSTVPVALNSAPRNEGQQLADSQESHIFRLRSGNKVELIYGPQVVAWIQLFRGKIDALEVIESVGIDSVNDLIENTSNGSQFRSAEHLPLVHALQAAGRLDERASTREVDPSEIQEAFADQFNRVVIVPPDEYDNGRVVANRGTIQRILDSQTVWIPGITDHELDVRDSLTKVHSGRLSIWPSSNHFPNEDLGVLNVGTRWRPGTTSTTDQVVIALSKKLKSTVGDQHKVQF